MPRGNPFTLQQVTILLLVLVSLTAAATSSKESITKDNLSNVRITRNMASMPLAFTANQGQWNDKVMFRANAGGATMWFASDGAYYQFTRTIESDDNNPISIVDKRYGMPIDDISGRQTSSSAPGIDREPEQYETMMIKANFVGSNANSIMRGIGEMEYKCNYFIGNDPNEWQTDVRNYSAVMYEEIYDGIDLKYYGNGKQMEYDFIVSPGADYSQIEIRYEGAESISINTSGELVVTTKWGKVIEQRPIIYQIENNSRIAVTGEYKMMGDNSFGFELSGNYNPALPLVIDPVLVYSTYLGGSELDVGTSIALDGSGNAYITGVTNSTNFPTLGAFQTDQIGSDVFVTKLNSSGNALVYSTYLGGNHIDHARGIAVDSSGNAYITGVTYSTDFPTQGAYQTDQGSTDVFVTKLNSSGNALVYSTYLGGNTADMGVGIALDGSGNAYITGYTNSTDFPTLNPFQGIFQGGALDAFVTKLSSSGNSLVYSTYLGGTDSDQANDIAVDGSGSAFVTGFTSSTDFPIQGAFQSTHQGISTDAFVTKLNSSGNALDYSTYLGGSSAEFGVGIALDGSGNAYITGRTDSPDFPTKGEYQTFQGVADVYVTKLSFSGDTLIYSTYLGGSDFDLVNDIAVNGSGNAYITGITNSTDYPTQGAFQTDLAGSDAFVTQLNFFGNALVYSTYLGGNNYDEGIGIAIDDLGDVYITGRTESTDFPTMGEYQTFQGGTDDVFVTKLTTICCVGNRGDLNGDGVDANILDLTFAVDRIFRGGAASDCPEEADINADGTPHNILDLTFLVDRIFRGGPPPGPC